MKNQLTLQQSLIEWESAGLDSKIYRFDHGENAHSKSEIVTQCGEEKQEWVFILHCSFERFTTGSNINTALPAIYFN